MRNANLFPVHSEYVESVVCCTRKRSQKVIGAAKKLGASSITDPEGALGKMIKAISRTGNHRSWPSTENVKYIDSASGTPVNALRSQRILRCA